MDGKSQPACPYCGGDKTHIGAVDSGYTRYVVCSNCLSSGPVARTDEEAQARWCKRAQKLTVSAQQDEREAHLDLLQDVLDAKAAMLKAGCKQDLFAAMFAEYAAQQVQADAETYWIVVKEHVWDHGDGERPTLAYLWPSEFNQQVFPTFEAASKFIRDGEWPLGFVAMQIKVSDNSPKSAPTDCDKKTWGDVLTVDMRYDLCAISEAICQGDDKKAQSLIREILSAAVSQPAPTTGDEREAFQRRVLPWMIQCFGPAITADRIERNHRFFEEATECVQANGMTRSEAHQLVDYTFDRPVGELRQEVGGVMVTLAALCIASDVDMHEAGTVELARVWQKIEQIRAKQAAKPKHSPLPEHVPEQASAAHRREDQQDAARLKGLRELCGYVENGSDTVVRIFQDDATRDWVVKVGNLTSYYGHNMWKAIDAAIQHTTAPFRQGKDT